MKRAIITILTILVTGIFIGFVWFRDQPDRVAGEPAPERPQTVVAENTQNLRTGAVSPTRLLTQSSDRSSSSSPGDKAAASPAFDSHKTILSQQIDAIVSSKTTYPEKRKIWEQLRDSGNVDQAISELQRRMTDDPGAAPYPATLGQAYLQKCATLQDVREQGLLALQADKLFDLALDLDPSNWEARFFKARAMTYWPANMNKGDEIISHFQKLIEQQETQTPQSQFADTYLLLGEQLQKTGQTDDARTIWKRGAALFPADESLKSKLSESR